jgi:hypothetical protein
MLIAVAAGLVRGNYAQRQVAGAMPETGSQGKSRAGACTRGCSSCASHEKTATVEGFEPRRS